MEEKYKKIRMCLLGVGAIQILMIGYSLYLGVQAYLELTSLGSQALLKFPISSFIPTLSILSLVFTALTLKELPKRNLTSWIMAILVFVQAAPGLALPFSIIGLITVFDESIRTQFFNEIMAKV